MKPKLLIPHWAYNRKKHRRAIENLAGMAAKPYDKDWADCTDKELEVQINQYMAAVR